MEKFEDREMRVDRNRCEGYGMCVQVAPDLLHLDEDDELVVDFVKVPEGRTPQAEAAVNTCPVAALSFAIPQQQS